LRNPVINVSGTYAVTVTDPVNGCTSDPSTVTTQESKTLPGVTLAPVTTITCGVPVVTLSATSPTAGVSYQWSGPNGFGSSEQQPGTSIPGSYTVTVTNPVNGCISTASTTVEENRAVPSNVTATIASPGVLTCTTTTVTLNGSSSTLGVTYAWAGPYGFAGSTQNITTTVPGIYILTVTNPVNGCTASAQVTVTQQIERPEGITAVASNVLTCTTTSATITGTSITSGVTYSWTGPGSFTSSSPSFSTSVAGTYTLTVMNPVSGCSSTPVSVVLTEDKAAPAISVSAPDGTLLTCFVSPVRLNGNSSTSGATFRWTSPTGFEATTPEISVTVPGDYTLTVTGANGCQVSTTRRITQTLTNPVASASVSGIISCSTPSVTLTGGSSGTPVTYQWSGPSGFTASQKDVANITIPGVYSLTIVTPGNCTDTKSVTVEKNITVPADVTAEFSGSLDCDGIVILQANSSTPGAIYKWTGPDGFETTEQEAVTTLPGRYILTVTHPVSGCVITREIIIEEGTC
jgi:hypothetical protein